MLRSIVLVALFTFSLPALARDSILCPDMPAPMTDINRNLKSEITAKIGTLGRVSAGELGIKTEIEAQNLLSKYPNVDRILTLQTMAATYCTMLRYSSLPEIDRLDRWERFQDRILGLQAAQPAAAPSSAPSNVREEQPKRPAAERRPPAAKGQITELPANAASNSNMTTLEDLLKQIRSSSAGAEKQRLKAAARATIASDISFGSVEHTDSKKHFKFSFVSYDPSSNILVVDEKYDYRDAGACNPACPSFAGRLSINLNKVDRVKPYSEGAFDLDCWYSAQYGKNRCVDYTVQTSTCRDGKRCDSGSDQNVGFYVPNNSRMVRFRNALQTIIYKIDGRPAI